MRLESVHMLTCDSQADWRLSSPPRQRILQVIMDGSDNLPMPEFSPLRYTPKTNAALLQSSSQTRASADSTTEMCVVSS